MTGDSGNVESPAGLDWQARPADGQDQAAQGRDQAADDRDDAAKGRDRAADDRDRAAEGRDQAADDRDRAAEISAASGSPNSADAVDSSKRRREAASDRARAIEDRREGARNRYQAEQNRSAAGGDRDASAGERGDASRDALNLAAIFESSGIAVIGKSLDGVIVSWSAGAQKLYGYSADEALGQATTILVPPDRSDELSHMLSEIRRGRPVEPFETVRLTKHGRSIDVWLTTLPVMNSAGEVTGSTTIQRNISERRQQVKLASAHRREMEVSRLKLEFLANMSHEIRTSMNGVVGLTELLLDTELDEIQRDYAGGVHASGKALLGIINDILDLSKIESGKLELETVDFDLVQVLEEVAALVAEGARRSGLELVAYCEPKVVTAVRGDAGRLRQILLNLISNAIKFTERGQVVLRAAMDDELSPETVAIRFEVADTGIGITSSDSERLFEPFSQAAASTTRHSGGTGLGLAICSRLAGAMGGAIGVESEVGKGSTFWVRLSFDRQAKGEKAAKPAVDLGPSQISPGLRALVVDDNETNREVLRAQLRAWGVEADAAPNAEGALLLMGGAAHRGKAYTVALVDVAMPGMSGLELAGALRSDRALSSTRLVLLGSTPAETEAAKEAGFGARTKPLRRSELYESVVGAPVGAARIVDEASKAVPVMGPRGNLLVVDDNRINRTVTAGILTRLGYRCDVAADGNEAIEALARKGYDAVLMDCQMEPMDGFEATAEIRFREGRLRHTPIIALTAGALAGDRDPCRQAGMDGYLSKPVDAEQLETMLSHFMGEPAGPPAVTLRASSGVS